MGYFNTACGILGAEKDETLAEAAQRVVDRVSYLEGANAAWEMITATNKKVIERLQGELEASKDRTAKLATKCIYHEELRLWYDKVETILFGNVNENRSDDEIEDEIRRLQGGHKHSELRRLLKEFLNEW